jgi:succinate-semialdehyde dehydrogenase/glutarate-semialdehyde dehydrogenase
MIVYQSALMMKNPFGLPLAVLATVSVRSISALTHNIHLKDPSLLSSPTVNFHRESLQVFDPAATHKEIEDGSAVVALVEVSDRKDAKQMIGKASLALPKWKHISGFERSKMIARWSELVKENADDLAKIMTLESGKPIKESYGEISYATSFLDFYAGECVRKSGVGGGYLVPSPFSHMDGSPKGKLMVTQEPVGVVAMITPWNFPVAMVTRKVGPALAAGCSVVLKPSELTPLSVIVLKNLADQAGIPGDIFQIIVSDQDKTPDIGEEFCSNPIVKKISFTGSTAVGKLLMRQSSESLKRLSLELGGNAPFIVFDDADIEQAAHAAVASKFRNAGQTCVCADRFIVHEAVEEEFIAALKGIVSKFNIGPGIDENTTMGPLISEMAAKSVEAKIFDSARDGAQIVYGGSLIPHLGPNFLQPTIVRNVESSSKLWCTETFGPVIAIATFRHEEEAIDLANDTPTGLASYFCSQDLSRVFRVAERLENGIVCINEGIFSTANAPFGGVKESGLGREGSIEGLSEYLEPKYTFLNH